MQANTAIEIKNLVKFYGKVQALRGVDLTVKQGEIFGFLGPNGAGKTTTIRCMLDTIRPQSGSIQVLGIDPQKDPVGVQRQVGYLPGELSLDSSRKVSSLLAYLIGLRQNHVDWSYVQQLAERLDLDMEIPVKNLSKGNKQKVGVIQALMGRPRLLLLDEPTSGLDPLMQQEVYHLLREAKGHGTTVFFSSHIINEVEVIADRVGIIRAGRIVEVADPVQLKRMSIRRIKIQFKEAVDPAPLGAVPGVALVNPLPGTSVMLSIEGDMDEVIKALAKFPINDLEIERPSLEEIFLTFYARGEQE